MGEITLELRLVFEIPESGLTINGMIGGLKEAAGQIHGKMLESLMRALEERLINEMVRSDPERYRRNGSQSKARYLKCTLGTIGYRFAQLRDQHSGCSLTPLVEALAIHLANCDRPRQSDLDGRGNLSEKALVAFTRFFLEVCIDQVKFMEELVQPDHLRTRILIWADEEIRLGRLPAKSASVLEAVLYRGTVPRGDAAGIVGTGERQSRRIVSALIDRGVLVSESPRAPLRLAFPTALASRWLPGLFPQRTE